MRGHQWRTPEPAHRGPEPVKWWASLRFRTGILMTMTSLLIVLVFGSFAVQSTGAGALERLRSEAVAVLGASAATYSSTGTVPTSMSLDSKTLPPGLAEAARPDTVVTYYDGHEVWAVQSHNGHLLSLSISDEGMRQELASLFKDLLWGALAVVVLASITGWVAASQLTRRIRTAARAAGRIGQGELETPIEVAGRDEVAAMSLAMEQMASSLAAMIERERAQTADAAHELRTPLTALVCSAELLEESRAATLVRSQVTRLRTLIEELLELARLTSAEEAATLVPADLGSVVTRIVAGLPEDKPCELRLVDPGRVLVEERRLERVLSNLVLNSHRHGGGPVSVTVEGPVVSVADQGPGYPEGLLREGPRRFSSSGRYAGSGLGLVIASHYAQSMSAILTLGNGAPRGALSSVALQPSPPHGTDPQGTEAGTTGGHPDPGAGFRAGRRS